MTTETDHAIQSMPGALPGLGHLHRFARDPSTARWYGGRTCTPMRSRPWSTRSSPTRPSRTDTWAGRAPTRVGDFR